MKKPFPAKLLFILVTAWALCLPACSAFAQDRFTIELTRKMYATVGNNEADRKFFTDTLHLVTRTNKDSTFRPIDQYNFIGGDFNDGKTKFTIAVDTKLKAKNIYYMYLAPYRADSVWVHLRRKSTSQEGIEAGSMVTIKAMGKTFGASLDLTGTSVNLVRLDDNYKNPDIEFYDSLMPDAHFALLNGGTSSFDEYKNKHKYVYVVFWSSWQPGHTPDIDQLKNTSDLYHDVLTVISFHSDTMSVKEIETEKNIDWVEAKDDMDNSFLPTLNGIPDGVLFNSEGKAIMLNVRPEELKPVIERLLHVTR